MEAKREDGAVIIPDGTNMTLAGTSVTSTPVFVREDGKELLQLREMAGIVPHLALCTVTGAWQGLPLQPLLQWLKENRPALLAPSYKPPAEWVQAAQEFIATATGQEWAEAERYYLQVYAHWTHQRSGITGVELPPLKKCPPLVQAGWLAVARSKAEQQGAAPPDGVVDLSELFDLSPLSTEELTQLKGLIAKGRNAGPALSDGVGILEFNPDGTLKLPPEDHWPTVFARLERREDGLVGHHRSGAVIMLRPATGAGGYVLRIPERLLPVMQQKLEAAQRSQAAFMVPVPWSLYQIIQRGEATLQELMDMAHSGAVKRPATLTADGATEQAALAITAKMGALLLGHPVTGKPQDFEALAQRHFLETGGTMDGWEALSQDERFRRKRWLEELMVGERREIGQWIGGALTGKTTPEQEPPGAETTADGQHIRRG